MSQIARLYRHINFLSIDVAAGAICSTLFFARILKVTVTPYSLIALALTVWVIYTVDHLRDARNIKTAASTFRHHYHQVHYKKLWYVVIIALVMDLAAICFIHHRIATGGLILIWFVVMYLILHRYIPFVKEFCIAILYTAGVLLPVVIMADLPFEKLPWLFIAQFLLTALINLLLFSWFDHQNDVKDGFVSLATQTSKSLITKIIVVLFLIVMALSFATVSRPTTWLILLMNLFLLILFLNPNVFIVNERFRLIGDAVFFIPGVLLWV